MFGICLWHVIMHGYGFEYIGTPDFSSDTSNLGFITFFCALLSPCTYCFMFISGWYGMKFSLKKYSRFIFMAISCFILGIALNYFIYGSIDYVFFLTHIFPISNSAWWFLTYYIFVFLISPFINLGFERLPLKAIKTVMLIMTFIEIARITALLDSSGSTFYGLLYIYMLARFLRKVDFTLPTKSLFAFYLFSLVLLWIICWFFATIEGQIGGYSLSKISFKLLGYNNLLIIIMAVTTFMLVLKAKPVFSPIVNKLSSNVLYVYLLTEITLGGGGYIFLYKVFESNIFLGGGLLLLIMVLCLLIGLLMSFCYSKLSYYITNNKRLSQYLEQLAKVSK